jgi:O-antigen ligase
MIHKNNTITSLLYLLYLGFILSLVFAFRAETSMAVGLLLIAGFIKNKTDTGFLVNAALKNRYMAACALFFVLQLTALFYTDHIQEGWKHVQIKSALLFIPLSFFCCTYLNAYRFSKLMAAYIYLLAAALSWCLIVSYVKYQFNHADITIFFYHQLVSSLGHHAVIFSILVFVALIYLLQTAGEGNYVLNRTIHFILILYFIAGMLLLASKMVIAFMAGYLLFYLFTTIKKNTNTRFTIVIITFLGILFTSIIVLTKNPVSRRFNDMLHGNINVIQQTSFSPGNYFNGVQFRLLQWRFVKEIVQENHAWLLGVSPGDAQNLLNQKYITTHMYTGRPGTADQGFLGYNTHNQFLESLLQTGIVGLLCFLVICFEMIKMAARQKNNLLSATVILLIIYSFNESVFETQYGLVLFTFLPLFFYFGAEKHSPLTTATAKSPEWRSRRIHH